MPEPCCPVNIDVALNNNGPGACA
ncbi:MAG: hypothetical protein JWP72_4293, partial [Massilia sp.]|nr:hypothetical protein [Massilia sp.]